MMNRIIVLDLLRFFAALFVVLYHYTFDGHMTKMINDINFQELGTIFEYGNLGVELFFMISGFVILLSSENKSILSFIISRATRLYPAYWVAVSLTAVVIFFFGGEHFTVMAYQYFVNLTMVQEGLHVRNIDGVYWTLFVEIRFYFLIFVLMLLRQMKFLKFYLLFWSLVSVLYHFIPLPGLVNFFLMPNVAPLFIAGSMFYIIYRDKKSTILDYFILLLSFISASMYLNQKFMRMEEAFNHHFNMFIIIAVLSVFYLLFYAISKYKLIIKTDKKIYIMMGAVTYPLYLIHAYIGYIIFNHLSPFVNKYVLLIGIIFFMLFIAYLIHIIIEKKLAKYMKQKMLYFSDIVTGKMKS